MRKMIWLPEAILFLFGQQSVNNTEFLRLLERHNIWYSGSYVPSACILYSDFKRLVKELEGTSGQNVPIKLNKISIEQL